jgi:hypothetical protein
VKPGVADAAPPRASGSLAKKRLLGAVGLFFVTLVAIGGCGEKVFLSKGDVSAAGPLDDPCKEKGCGDSCLFDACAGSGNGTICDTPEAAGSCDANGQCTLDAVDCKAWVPCSKKTSKCGDTCWPCDPKSPSCTPPGNAYQCTDTFKCLPGKADCNCVGVDCPAPAPCQDLNCGDPCVCDPNLSENCPQDTSALTLCDANDRCLPVEQVACPKGYKPCENVMCGLPCSVCDPKNKNCKEDLGLVCDAVGECTLPPVACQMPCTTARCGEPCLPCDPMSPGCVLPMSSYCDEYGSCQPGDAPYCPCSTKSCGDACFFCDASGNNCSTDDRVCDVDSNCVNNVPAYVCP